MGWFDKQIKDRINNDNDSVENSFFDMTSVLMGKSKKAFVINNKRIITHSAVEEICKFYHVVISDIPDNITDINEQLEYMLRPSGIMKRRVALEGDWWKDCNGPMLCETLSGNVAALIPSGNRGYKFFDYETGMSVSVNSKTAKKLQPEAICFYKPLPQRPLSVKDLFSFIISTISRADCIMIIAAGLAVSLLGMILPSVNSMIFSDIIPAGKKSLVLSVSFLMIGASLSTFLINVTKSLLQAKIKSKMDIALQSAVMARIVNLPTQFFKDYSAGSLAGRVSVVNSLSEILCNIVFGVGLTAFFSLVYLTQMLSFAPSLVGPAIGILIIQLGVAVLGIQVRMKLIRKQMEANTKVQGIVFALFSGIQKIRLSGCEKRAFSKWAKLYSAEAATKFNPPLFLKLQSVFSTTIVLLGTGLIYLIAASSVVEVSQYVAFNVAFGLVSGSILSLTSVATAISYIKPIIEMIDPILKAQPEVSMNKKVVNSLSGQIELNNVSFKYTEDGPLIINDLSLKIRRGQYVAIVGKTGCGKSTLLRMLLGFERPKTGAIYYDGVDVEKVDLKSLRRNIGVVMQNGKLFAGDIYSNITISAPWLNLEEAWKAAEMAGVAEDIRNMPMEMHTLISEGSGGISGGQRQRLMIARAIAPQPKVLMFDEATSALDNITQKQVSESLSKLKSTRIVIAHRLSTIRECDRIIVLDKGKIIEDGKYEDLIQQNGYFAELVRRQQIDTPNEEDNIA